MKTPAQHQGRQLGTAVLEFAFVAFIFFLLMWGFFEFGRAFYVVNSAQHLTRCIARSAVVHKPSEHEAAKDACLMTGGQWPLFTLEPADLRGVFRLAYAMVPGPGQPTTTVQDTDIGKSTAYDNQVNACTQQVNCVVTVTAYFDAAASPIETFGLLATWMQSGSSTYTGFRAETTMTAESMGWSPP